MGADEDPRETKPAKSEWASFLAWVFWTAVVGLLTLFLVQVIASRWMDG